MVREVILVIAFGIPSFAQQTCPVTAGTPSAAFKPPAPYSSAAPGPGFWYGTRQLWTYIAPDPLHVGGPDKLSAKLAYWRVGFQWTAEYDPDLKVIAKRFDARAALIESLPAHGIKFNGDDTPGGMAMGTGIAIPEPGCWQIVATYKGIHTLSYFVRVIP